MKKEFIKNFTLPELLKFIVGIGLPAYRAEQIYNQIIINRKSSFDEINNIPRELRTILENQFEINALTHKNTRTSKDGTQKFLYQTYDGNYIETVLIPDVKDYKERLTLCISTQVGCNYDCVFCATGKMGFTRNLETAEILEQFFLTEKISGEKINNIVFMGMGEPLLNYDNVVKSIKILTNEKYKILGRKRITLSTVGVVPGIERLADEGVQTKLAISLHSPDDVKRAKIIPAAKKWKIKEILLAASKYYNMVKLPITFEYIMFRNFNDTDDDVLKLAKLCRSFPCKVNLIPYHNISFAINENYSNLELEPTPFGKIIEFAKLLRESGVDVFIRNSSGKDIEAACGQLALKY